MTILYLVSRLLTNFTLGQSAAVQSIQVAADLYRKSGFLYTSAAICINNAVFHADDRRGCP
jgi:hypothetical protein